MPPYQTQPSAQTFVIAREDQLRALLDVRYGVHLLAQFRSPDAALSASEVARLLGEPAPRVTYHVRRLETLGLLVPAGPPGAGRARRLRPVARRFTLTAALRGLLDAESIRPFLGALTDAMLGASAAWDAGNPHDHVVFDLDRQDWLAQTTPGTPRLLMLTRRLTPQAFERACAAAWDALRAEPEAAPDAPGARHFTLSLLAFPGSVLPIADPSITPADPLDPSADPKEHA